MFVATLNKHTLIIIHPVFSSCQCKPLSIVHVRRGNIGGRFQNIRLVTINCFFRSFTAEVVTI